MSKEYRCKRPMRSCRQFSPPEVATVFGIPWRRRSPEAPARMVLLKHREHLVDVIEHADQFDEKVRERIVAGLKRDLRNVDAALGWLRPGA